MKKLRRLLSFILLGSLLFTTPAFASNYEQFSEIFSYDNYLEQVENGYIDEKITYDMLLEMGEVTFEDLKEEMDNNPNFTLIYETESFDMNSPEFRAAVTQLNPGDVFIMNSGASAGLSGHAALALSNTEIINIAGPNTTTEILTKANFNELYRYRDILLYRTNNYYWGVDAAVWADNTYRNNPAAYSITLDYTSTNPTYCSKLVYQAYRYGAGSDSLYPAYTISPVGLIGPYVLPNVIRMGQHGEYNPY